MPTYEYRCEACKHEFEAFHSMSAKPIALCPKCKKRKVKRLISKGGGLIFKGSGFYLTDYARNRGSDKTKADAKAGTAAETKPAHSSDEASAKSEATGATEKTDTKKKAPAKAK